MSEGNAQSAEPFRTTRFDAKGGAHFHLDSDQPGIVGVGSKRRPDEINSLIPIADLLEFADAYRAGKVKL